jgi:hypothetical protein
MRVAVVSCPYFSVASDLLLLDHNDSTDTCWNKVMKQVNECFKSYQKHEWLPDWLQHRVGTNKANG